MQRRIVSQIQDDEDSCTRRSMITFPIGLRRYYHEARGLYRVFNAAEYRFYRSNSAPPEESDTPFATNATLPHEPVDLYANGTWYISMSYFNGVIDSGFLPIGASGETYLRLDLSAGVEINSPPKAPGGWSMVPSGLFNLRFTGFYYQTGTLRATQWALTYDMLGGTPGTPPAVSPTYTEAFVGTRGLVFFKYDLDFSAGVGSVEARLQVRRSDDGGSTWQYSEGSDVKTHFILSSATGHVDSVGAWPGRLPEDVT